ncbi:MAG: hypothetical protein ACHQ3P_08970 [Candidatus Limnocylindrales bacterium]
MTVMNRAVSDAADSRAPDTAPGAGADATPPPAPEPTHPCVRCGRPVPIGTAMCDHCNPLGLADPAASQAHGTIFLAIGVGVVLLALVGRFFLVGIGPFDSAVTNVALAVDAAGAPNGLAVTLQVTNRGSRAGASTCQVRDRAAVNSDHSAIFVSPEIAPGETATFTRTTSLLGLLPTVSLQVDCSQP